jgi:hypothetical protein
MDWSAVGGLVGQAAPTIGGLLGGFIPFPGGAFLGELAGKAVAAALGVPPTPEAVHQAVTTGDPDIVKAKLAAADVQMQADVEKYRLQLEDVQNARATNLALVNANSSISYAPSIVSGIILVGFLVLSFLAMKPELTGVRTDVTLFLLGAWSGYAGAVVTYWLGSSASSAQKSDQIAVMAGTAATVSAKAVAAGAAKPGDVRRK